VLSSGEVEVIKRLKRIKIVPDSAGIGRAVALSGMAIALAVYAMVMHERKFSVVLLGATILLIAIGAILQVARAVRLMRLQHDRLHVASQRAERHYLKVLRRILAAVEARQDYSRGRSKRIGGLTRRVALRLGMDSNQSRLLDLAGQVHDIGLLAVPERILNKPARLGGDEFRAIQRHAEISYRILEPLTFLAEALPAIRYHHERMNGTGYPFQLRGEAIPLAARILAVVDAYDAMTHDRPYRPALTPFDALEELRRCCPAGYDENCVAALEGIMNMKHLQDAHEPTPAPAHA
jgi:HD-GYP domain-containing protein (c-di-GMP phosphodiesterase class II)